jgi:hypothetical protein
MWQTGGLQNWLLFERSQLFGIRHGPIQKMRVNRIPIYMTKIFCALISKIKTSLKSCQPNYYGRRCEIFGLKLSNGTIIKYNRSCNLTISVFNQGGYTARFFVDYQDFNGKTFREHSSSILSGQTRHVQVPFYGKNLSVQIYTSLGELIKNDTSLVSDLPCQKCNKVWGVVGYPKWDYITCWTTNRKKKHSLYLSCFFSSIFPSSLIKIGNFIYL